MSIKDLKLITPELIGKTAIQVGSQSGQEAEYLAELGFMVLCIDPEPLHKPTNQISILTAAASDEPGMALLFRAGGMNSLDSEYVKKWRGENFVDLDKAVLVPVVRLKDLNLDPSLVVIDAEGTDHRVLRGLFNEGPMPDVIMFEMTKTYPERCQDGLNTLNRYGYRRFLVIFHCGDDVLDVREFDGKKPPVYKDDVDWFANIVCKLDRDPWRLNG